MTSNISFYKLLKEDVKKRAWLFWLSLSIFMILFPVVTMMRIDSVLYWSADDMNYVKEWFMESELGNGWVGFFVTAGAILGAVSSFTHLHSKRQIDFYHSLPVKRELWFITAYVSSFIQIMIPCVCSQIIRYAIASIKGVTTKESIAMLGFVIGILLLSYHLVYIVSSIGMIVTGKLLTGILMIAFLQIWGAFVVSLKEMVLSSAFETYLSMEEAIGYGSAPIYLTGQTWKCAPVFLYYSMLHLYLDKKSMTGLIWLSILAGILLSVLAIILYKKRPSEAAGKSVAFPILEPVLKVLLAVTIGLFFANMTVSQYEAVKHFPIWLFLVAILAASFVCLVLEFIYSGDLKMLLKKKISFGISLAATVILCAVFQFDLIGYDTYLPPKEKIDSMCDLKMLLKKKISFGISLAATVILCAVFQFDLIGYDTYLPPKEKIDSMLVEFLYENADIFENSFTYSEGAEKRRLEALRTENFDRIYKAAQNGISCVEKEIDQWDNEKYVPVKMAYFLKNGRVVYRKYFLDYMEMYQCMDSLFADREYRRKYFDIDKLGRDQYYFSSVDMYLGTHHTFPSPQKRLDVLLDTYIEELETAPFSVFEKANLIATLQFVKGNHYMDFPVYEEFTKTLELLDKEFTDFRKLSAQDISFMTVEYEKSDAKDGEMIKKTIERENIQQVLDSMCYVQTGFVGRIAEENTYVTLGTTMGPEYNYFIREGEFPEFLREGIQ